MERQYTAQICVNGHIATHAFENSPQDHAEFCPVCGSPTITTCKNCSTNIKGWYDTGTSLAILSYVKPNFCYKCGKPFPWTEAKLEEAKKLTNTFNISPQDKLTLIDSIDDLVKNTARVETAILKFKDITSKVSAEAKDTLKQILASVITEGIKKTLGW